MALLHQLWGPYSAVETLGDISAAFGDIIASPTILEKSLLVQQLSCRLLYFPDAQPKVSLTNWQSDVINIYFRRPWNSDRLVFYRLTDIAR